MRKSTNFFAALCLSLIPIVAQAEETRSSPLPAIETARQHPVASRNGIVVAGERVAAEVGAEILAKGGNAVDAAVATGFALAVTFPRAGNIGGGGFMLVHLNDEDRTIAIDYREMAPALANRDVYLNEDGTVNTDDILFTHKSSGVPGTVAGLLHALENYGTMSRAEVMAPAIRLAERGVTVTYFSAAMVDEYKDRLSRYDATREQFFKADGRNYEPGDTIRYKDLAKTLRRIARDGHDGFYTGRTAETIATQMEQNGGLIRLADLENYKVVERTPVTGTYNGYKIISMPPPSSGGIHLIQMLNMLELFGDNLGARNTAGYFHLLTEVMRSAFADRAEHLGDTDFVDVPVSGLTSKTYARQLVEEIDPATARESKNVAPGTPQLIDSTKTTHFSVFDKNGNVVSNTYTLNLSFGSGVVIDGTGILMNNQMDDFSAKPGAPNSYGLIGNEKNAIAAFKRPLSSMTPVIVTKDGAPVLVSGGAGGSRIITSVLQVVLNVLEHDMNVADASSAPRMHHQWLPDNVLIEDGISQDTVRLLEAMSHDTKPFEWHARTQSATYKDGWAFGYPDRRMPGGGACTPDTPC